MTIIISHANMFNKRSITVRIPTRTQPRKGKASTLVRDPTAAWIARTKRGDHLCKVLRLVDGLDVVMAKVYCAHSR